MQCLAVVDVMITLANYSRCGDGVMCRPQIVAPSTDTRVSGFSLRSFASITYVSFNLITKMVPIGLCVCYLL